MTMVQIIIVRKRKQSHCRFVTSVNLKGHFWSQTNSSRQWWVDAHIDQAMILGVQTKLITQLKEIIKEQDIYLYLEMLYK